MRYQHTRYTIWSNVNTTILVTIFGTIVLRVDGLRQDLMTNVPVPEFLPGVLNKTEREGDFARLPCAIRHLGTKEVVWRRVEEDRILTIGKMTWIEDPNISLDHSRKPGHISQWDLIIRHLKPKDNGLYECRITSKIDHVRLVMLNVVGPALTKPDSSQLTYDRSKGSVSNLTVSVCGRAEQKECLIAITGRRYVNLGDPIHLVCNASGGVRIPDEIDWFKAGDKIDSAKYRHIIIEKYKSMADRSFISKLIIEHSSHNDTGDYICRSSRNDIANLKVTVLHAGRDNFRRGTAETDKSPLEDEQPFDNSSYLRPPRVLTITLGILLVLRQFC